MPYLFRDAVIFVKNPFCLLILHVYKKAEWSRSNNWIIPPNINGSDPGYLGKDKCNIIWNRDRFWINAFKGTIGNQRKDHKIAGIFSKCCAVIYAFVVRPCFFIISHKQIFRIKLNCRKIWFSIKPDIQRDVVAYKFGTKTDHIKNNQYP